MAETFVKKKIKKEDTSEVEEKLDESKDTPSKIFITKAIEVESLRRAFETQSESESNSDSGSETKDEDFKGDERDYLNLSTSDAEDKIVRTGPNFTFPRTGSDGRDNFIITYLISKGIPPSDVNNIMVSEKTRLRRVSSLIAYLDKKYF